MQESCQTYQAQKDLPSIFLDLWEFEKSPKDKKRGSNTTMSTLFAMNFRSTNIIDQSYILG